MKQMIIACWLTAFTSIAGAQESASRTGDYTATSTVLELLGAKAAKQFSEKIPIDQPITGRCAGVYQLPQFGFDRT